MKICFIASSGGHWEELMSLKEIAKKNDAFYVTEIGGQVYEDNREDLYLVKQINRREKYFIFNFIKLIFKCFSIIRKENPELVITTGALIAVPFSIIAKMYGAKIIYIESFARINNASLTGKIMYKYADMFLVQWKEMLKIFPKAKYVGGVF